MYEWQKENLNETPARSSKFGLADQLDMSRISRSINRTTLNPHKESTGRYFQASHKDSFFADQSSFERKLGLFEASLEEYSANGNKKHVHTVGESGRVDGRWRH